MATNLPAISAPRAVSIDIDAELVGKIIEKTVEGKIKWEKIPTGHAGRSSDLSLQIQLVTMSSPFGRKAWTSFNVKRYGEEILNAENNAGGLLLLSGIGDGLLHQRIGNLLTYLETSRQRSVKEALSDLSRL